MRTLIKLGIFLLIVAAIVGALWRPVGRWWHERNLPKWKTEAVSRGDIVTVVNATGQVKPVLSVEVGSFVSGPIIDLPVEFNDEVEEGQLLARVDPRIYQANVDRDVAVLRIQEAEINRVGALLQQARNDERRALGLRAKNKDFLSQAELDKITFQRMSLEAQFKVAEASIQQAFASLENSLTNLAYTEITSPVAGIVIDRKIDRGQTLAASFQTPQLFIVAPQMREKIHVHASIDEADIGLIRRAKEKGMDVSFTVDAYPDDLFEGVVEEIRFSSTTTQNVVTYPVIVAAKNPDLKLLPGMTANLSFQVDDRDDVLRIPNSALRFYPQSEHVREEDRDLLEGASVGDEGDEEDTVVSSARERAENRRKRKNRHVWVKDGELLRAIEVEAGLSDNRFTELVAGDLKEGQQLATRLEGK